jgi:regulator of sigma E protease
MVFFWVLAMLGSEQVRPVIGAVESGSMAAKAGLSRSGNRFHRW